MVDTSVLRLVLLYIPCTLLHFRGYSLSQTSKNTLLGYDPIAQKYDKHTATKYRGRQSIQQRIMPASQGLALDSLSCAMVARQALCSAAIGVAAVRALLLVQDGQATVTQIIYGQAYPATAVTTRPFI